MTFDNISIFADLKDIEGKKPSEISYLVRNEYIVLMRAAGFTINAIAERTGVSRVTVMNSIKDYSEEIRRLQLAAWEELMHAHQLTLRQRAENYAKDLNRIDQELEKRDWSKIPTEKLLELKLKLHHAFVDDIIERIARRPGKQNFRLEKIGAEF